jgi:hypothetical protein
MAARDIRTIADWGDTGDGYYQNPILQGDFSDPDAVRVGDTWYMVNSTMQLAPGITILRSKDLVNWETIGHVIDHLEELDPEMNWDRMKGYDKGVYAPSLRYLKWTEKDAEGNPKEHTCWFVHTTLYERGFVVATAENIRGPWKTQYMKDCRGRQLKAPGWDDPCPYWKIAADGSIQDAFLVTSKVNGAWFPHLFHMSPDGTTLLDGDLDFMDKAGDRTAGKQGVIPDREGLPLNHRVTGEANKLFRISPDTLAGSQTVMIRNGLRKKCSDFVYFFQSAVFRIEGVDIRIPILHRALSVYGDRYDAEGNYTGEGTVDAPGEWETIHLFEDSPILKEELEPDQGAFVDVPAELSRDGKEKWYFLTHHGSEKVLPWCRPVSLLEVRWENGWPFVNRMQWRNPKPVVGMKKVIPQSDLEQGVISPDWQWNFVPRKDCFSSDERPGMLRMYAFHTQDESDSLFSVGNILSQHYLYGRRVQAELCMDISGMEEGQEAGIAHFNGGADAAWYGVRLRDQTLDLVEHKQNNYTNSFCCAILNSFQSKRRNSGWQMQKPYNFPKRNSVGLKR